MELAIWSFTDLIMLNICQLHENKCTRSNYGYYLFDDIERFFLTSKQII